MSETDSKAAADMTQAVSLKWREPQRCIPFKVLLPQSFTYSSDGKHAAATSGEVSDDVPRAGVQKYPFTCSYGHAHFQTKVKIHARQFGRWELTARSYVAVGVIDGDHEWLITIF